MSTLADLIGKGYTLQADYDMQVAAVRLTGEDAPVQPAMFVILVPKAHHADQTNVHATLLSASMVLKLRDQLNEILPILQGAPELLS